MESFRNSLPEDFLKRLQRELGCEESLRLLWPVAVGPRLAGNTRLKGVRGGTLIVSVPHRSWRGPLAAFEKMIVGAVNRFWGADVCHSVEFLEDVGLALSGEGRHTRVQTAQEISSVDLPVGMIADAELREMFLQSAGKYFAGQEGRRN